MAAAIAALTPLADEVVVGVPPGKQEVFARRGWRVVEIPDGPDGTTALLDACRAPWRYLAEVEDRPSAALLALLPELLAGPPERYGFMRRWVTPDAHHWLDELPWTWDSATALLHRDAPAGDGPHEPTVRRAESVLRLSAILRDQASRRRGVLREAVVELGSAVELRGGLVRRAEPERYARQVPAPLSPQDAEIVDVALRGAALTPRPWSPPTTPPVDPGWPEVTEPPPIARERRPAQGQPIPRVVHRVWLGGRPLPDAFAEFGRTWERHHPEWEVRLWTDENAPTPAGLERTRNLAERADLVRYEIIRRHGGIYVDTDIECLRPIDELLEGVVLFAGYEVPGRLCNAVFGAVPEHPAFAEAVRAAEVVAGHGIYPDSTATTFLTYLLEAHDDATLFAADRFYPELWDGRRNDAAEPPYTAHHWSHSWEGQD